MRRLTVAATIALAAAALTACEYEGETPSSQAAETNRTQKTYDGLTKSQPAGTMSYSPTRATKNFWVETWDEPGKVAYVYLMAGDGSMIGYYVTEGLPVSYCTSLIPPTKVQKFSGADWGTAVQIPQPSVDGTYSSGSNCNAFYGKDAVTGSYIEYSVGMGINALIFDQPMSRQRFAEAQPLGPGTIDKVKPQ